MQNAVYLFLIYFISMHQTVLCDVLTPGLGDYLEQ